jgi:preprotein translocase subunit YajC
MKLFDLIPSAYAQTAAPAAAPGAADLLQNFAPIILIVVIFYFLMLRPQQQKAKQLRNQLAQLRRGDSVVTSGGIIGTVYRVVSDNEIMLEIADGVRARVVRSTITGIMSKTEPSDKGDEANDDAPAPKPARKGKTAPAAKLVAVEPIEAEPAAATATLIPTPTPGPSNPANDGPTG